MVMCRNPVISIALALVLVSVTVVPAFMQGPPLADIESEIDAVQWAVVYHQKDGFREHLGSLRLLIILEIADKFVERAMVKYSESGEVDDKVERCLYCAAALLEHAGKLDISARYDISSDINKAIRTEVLREEVLGSRGGLKDGDVPWSGDSIGGYGNCTTASDYINMTTSRLNLWLQE